MGFKNKQYVIDNEKLLKEWNEERNKNLNPEKTTLNSGRKVWWQCEKGHEWEAVISSRSRGNGCPYCANKKVLKGFNDLATINPELAKEWHPTKNGDLTPSRITSVSGRKVWWQCEKGHEWEAVISNRSRGNGCPYCANKKVLKGFNDLATTHPEVAKQWHPTKNGDLTSQDIIAGSNKFFWWRCEKGHEWEMSGNERCFGNYGCPYCSGKKVIKGENDLATINPKLAKEWHPTKNGDLTPQDVFLYSNKKIWWRCEKEHEWQATIGSRAQGAGCPYCSGRLLIKGKNDLATINPELAKEWHPTKNGDLTPTQVTSVNGKKVWWRCEKGHEWKAVIANRTYGTGCPRCASDGTSYPEQCLFYYLSKVFDTVENRYQFKRNGNKVELDIYIPELLLAIEYDGFQWHKNKEISDLNKSVLVKDVLTLIRIRENGLNVIDEDFCIFTNGSTIDIECFVHKVFDFIVSNFDLELKIKNRIKEININLLRDEIDIRKEYLLRSKQKSLMNLNPELAKEWHYEKNNGLLPENFSANSHANVWWRCKKGHEWQAIIKSRNSKKAGCPYCSNKKTLKGFNDLATTHPEITKQWHPTKNGGLTPCDVVAGSSKNVWWRCEKGHEWQKKCYLNVRYPKCPECKAKRTLNS